MRKVSETLSLTLNQALIFFIFMTIGFVFSKTKYVSDKFGKVLSQMLMNVVLPGLCFKTFSQNVTMDNIGSNLKFFVCGVILTVIMAAIAIPLGGAFSKNADTKEIYRYALCVPNSGYFGFPMIQAVFGEQALVNTMVFTIPLNIFIYTVAQYMLDPEKKFTLKKLLNPTLLSMVAGIAAGLIGLKIPGVITEVCGSAAACMSPLAMTMTGFVLARIPMRKLLVNPKAYLVSLLRLVVIPVLMLGVMTLLNVEKELTLIAVAVYAMPVGLNAVVFTEAFGGDSRTGAQVCFISTVFALLTLPVIFMFLR